MADDFYRNSRFLIRSKGRVVAGFSKVSIEDALQPFGLHPEHDDPETTPMTPGSGGYSPFRLERGLSCDTDFVDWADQDWSDPDHADGSRRMIEIVACDETGAVVVTWTVRNTWVSQLARLPDPASIGAPAGAVAIDWLILQNEGWTRSR